MSRCTDKQKQSLTLDLGQTKHISIISKKLKTGMRPGEGGTSQESYGKEKPQNTQ